VGPSSLDPDAPPRKPAAAQTGRSAGDTIGSERMLRQALALYREIGATGHAERLTREIPPASIQGEQP
jgi:hypothetical protein